jgi:DNA topoisomerase III
LTSISPILCLFLQVFRARFSAISAPEIHHAMEHLTSPNENESRAVDARQELDLKVGVSFSRFQTMFFQVRKMQKETLTTTIIYLKL